MRKLASELELGNLELGSGIVSQLGAGVTLSQLSGKEMDMEMSQTSTSEARLAARSVETSPKSRRNSLQSRRRTQWLLVWLAGMFYCSAILHADTPALSRGQNVLRATLANGMRVIVVRNPLAPVVTTIVNYRVGSDECPPGFGGKLHAPPQIK